MKQKTGTWAILCILLAMALSLVGCSSTEAAPKSSRKRGMIDIQQIAWEVDEGIVDGERFILLAYTNNTPYTIREFEIKYREKPGLTEEEKAQYYADVQQMLRLDEEVVASLKGKGIAMSTGTERLMAPGASISNVNCYYYSGSFYLKDINHYKLMEPDIATIRYIDNNEIVTVYYDFTSGKYSVEEKTEPTDQWTKSDLGTKIPKPEASVIESSHDRENSFDFEAYGMTLDQFNAYVEKCKELGFTVDETSFEDYYSANDTEGYDITLHYYERSQSISGSIDAPN